MLSVVVSAWLGFAILFHGFWLTGVTVISDTYMYIYFCIFKQVHIHIRCAWVVHATCVRRVTDSQHMCSASIRFVTQAGMMTRM